VTARGGFARTYTPAATRAAEQAVASCWEQSGGIALDGPLWIDLLFATDRPQSHWLKNDRLSTEAKRHPYPIRKPDIDNLCKLILDALNGKAYRDDTQVCDLKAQRIWADRDFPYTTVKIGRI
jgi:Holliday junction resolvase RusA-like endonuclease